MAKAKVVAQTGASPNTHNPLILAGQEPVGYLGLQWRCQFFFNNLDELQQVALLANRADSGKTVETALQASGWQMAFLETPDAAYDYLGEAKTQGSAKAEALARDFAQAVPGASESLAISFLPAQVAATAMEKGYDFNQAVDNAGENLVVIRLVATPDNLRLSFTAPLLSRKNALRYGQMIRKN